MKLNLLCLMFFLAAVLSSCSINHPSGLPVAYHNSRYDLTFYLPPDWRGHSVATEQWNGQTYVPTKDRDETVAHGPVIELLRSPPTKSAPPYQDIPIMIFTRQQWDDLHHGKYDAAGAGGSIYELWHNDKYVFGIHSRYNWNDSVLGWDAAQKIVDQNCVAHPTLHLYSE